MIDLFDPDRHGWTFDVPEKVLVGPPGTGKTRAVLTSWILPALAELDPDKIIACSFTKAAAIELRERVSEQAGIQDWKLLQTCSTIHSIAYRMIGHPPIWEERMAGDPTRVRTSKDGDSDLDQPLEGMSVPCKELRAEARRLWDLGRTIEHGLAKMEPSESDVSLVLSAALRRTETRRDVDELRAEILTFEAQKQAVGAIDFTDMLLHALWSGEPLHKDLMIVDEAQDLSPLQIALIGSWSRECKNLVWVGDPDQGIYAFAGADGHHLTSLIRDGVPSWSLQQSYRVPSEIHILARKTILLNKNRVDSPYLPMEKTGSVTHADTYRDQSDFIEENEGREMFILARTKARVGAHAVDLSQRGIPFLNERGKSPWQSGVLRKLVLCISDLLAGRLVGREALLAYVSAVPGRPRSPLIVGTKKDAKAAVKALDDGKFTRADEVAGLGIDIGALKRLKTLNGALSHMGKLEACTPLMMILDRYGTNGLRNEPSITITTMHASKGREAPAVLLDLETPFPVKLMANRGDVEGIESERRVLYVAITRAKDALCMRRTFGDLADVLGVDI